MTGLIRTITPRITVRLIPRLALPLLVAALALAACSSDSGSSDNAALAAERAAAAAERAAQAAERAADASQDARSAAESGAQSAAESGSDASEAATAAAERAADAADRAAQAAQRAAQARQSDEQAEPADDEPGEITIYSGRGESLVGALLERFEAETGIRVRIRYAGTAELAVAILEEGGRSPADVYYAQDAGALGALADAGALAVLPSAVLDRVDPKFRDSDGRWVGTSGRARVLVISPERVPNPPASIFELTEPEWRGRVGWAPTNGSFQAFVTAMRQIHGEDVTAEWLRGMLANDVREYPKNSPQVQAVGDGELDIGLVNHYYLYRFLDEDPDFAAANHFTDSGRAGALINVAGVGMLSASDNRANALRFIEYLLEAHAQEYFRDQTSEYPLTAGIAARPELAPLDQLDPPSLALTSLADLEGTLELLQEVGALP